MHGLRPHMAAKRGKLRGLRGHFLRKKYDCGGLLFYIIIAEIATDR